MKELIENRPVLISVSALLIMVLSITGFAFGAGQYKASLESRVNNVETTYAGRLEILEQNQSDIMLRLNQKDVRDATMAADIRYIRETLDELKGRTIP